MFQGNEVINLAMGAIALVIVGYYARRNFAGLRLFYLGFLLMLGKFIFTVVEGVAYSSLFDFLEHLLFALAGVTFAAACLTAARTANAMEEPE